MSLLNQWRNNDWLENLVSASSVFPKTSLHYILDYSQGSYVAVGPGKDTFLGYKSDYLKDAGLCGFYELLHPDDYNVYKTQLINDRAGLLDKMYKAGHENISIRSGYRIRSKSGEMVSLAQQSSYISSKEGLSVVWGTITDITHFVHDSRMLFHVSVHDKQTNKNTTLFSKFYFPDPEVRLLGNREIEILKWICDGFSSKQIADKLCISIYTVNAHRANILQKTNCRNFAEVIKYAITNGIL